MQAQAQKRAPVKKIQSALLIALLEAEGRAENNAHERTHLNIVGEMIQDQSALLKYQHYQYSTSCQFTVQQI